MKWRRIKERQGRHGWGPVEGRWYIKRNERENGEAIHQGVARSRNEVGDDWARGSDSGSWRYSLKLKCNLHVGPQSPSLEADDDDSSPCVMNGRRFTVCV
jgi:hypothetical protein